MNGSALLPSATRVFVDENTVLDARLALYHRAEHWLAIADVHYGYELSQRASGALFPLWGMRSVEGRLLALLTDYRPERLIIAGDFVHDSAAREPARRLLRKLRTEAACEVVLIAGNHDRRAFDMEELCGGLGTDGFYFHHGDGHGFYPEVVGERISIIGHHHPAGTLYDGAGLALKLPAFVQANREWVLPAFSPWAAGGTRAGWGEDARIWLCGKKRILPPWEARSRVAA